MRYQHLWMVDKDAGTNRVCQATYCKVEVFHCLKKIIISSLKYMNGKITFCMKYTSVVICNQIHMYHVGMIKLIIHNLLCKSHFTQACISLYLLNMLAGIWQWQYQWKWFYCRELHRYNISNKLNAASRHLRYAFEFWQIILKFMTRGTWRLDL